MARQMVDVYADFAVNGAAMPVIAGMSSLALFKCKRHGLSLSVTPLAAS